MGDAEHIVRLCRALAVETRVQIIAHLRAGALCVGALAARLNVTQSAVSQHLRILRDAGLVLPERRGYFIHYRLNPAGVQDSVDAVRRQLLGSAENGQNETKPKGGETSCARRKANAKSRRT